MYSEDFCPKRILVCQQRQIGDVVLTTAAVQLLKKRFPDALIDFFTEVKCAELLENHPDINTVHALDKKNIGNFLEELAWYWKHSRNDYDLVVDFQQLPRCRWMTLFSGAKVRMSFTPPWYNRLLYTHWTDEMPGYEAWTKASVLAPLGVDWRSELPRVYTLPEERNQAEYLYRDVGFMQDANEVLVTVDPTHKHQTRRWPKKYYAELLMKAYERDSRLRFLVLYGPGEKDEAMEVVSHYRARGGSSKVLAVLPGPVSLRLVAACIERADMHLGTCSSPRHIAVAVGTPSFAVIGGGVDSWTCPASEHMHVAKALECRPCSKCDCPLGTVECLETLMPDEVLEEFMRHLNRNVPEKGDFYFRSDR